MKKLLNLKEYEKIAGKKTINEILARAGKFSGKRIVAVNSTYQGGGVAELLNSLVFLFNEAGIKFGWRTLHGTPYFFDTTKKIHNALQGDPVKLSVRRKSAYREVNRRFSAFSHIDHDLVIIHDPQPLPLIEMYKKNRPWIWRCHIDISNPDRETWDYLLKYINKYDRVVISSEKYKKDLRAPQSVIMPAIDPLGDKNKPLPEKFIARHLKKYGISFSKPIISQISRFDKWKDPLGVIRVFEITREKTDCQLVLLGSLAADDPEGLLVLEETRKAAAASRYKEDIRVILTEDDLLVNCLQRKSSIVMQKSLREGFALTVSEALFKETPVIASNIGGIPLQIKNGENGFFHDPCDYQGFSESIIAILKDKRLAKNLGQRGREYVIDNFLITRLMLDWLELFKKYL